VDDSVAIVLLLLLLVGLPTLIAVVVGAPIDFLQRFATEGTRGGRRQQLLTSVDPGRALAGVQEQLTATYGRPLRTTPSGAVFSPVAGAEVEVRIGATSSGGTRVVVSLSGSAGDEVWVEARGQVLAALRALDPGARVKR
jgi:hypothetical protein